MESGQSRGTFKLLVPVEVAEREEPLAKKPGRLHRRVQIEEPVCERYLSSFLFEKYHSDRGGKGLFYRSRRAGSNETLATAIGGKDRPNFGTRLPTYYLPPKSSYGRLIGRVERAVCEEAEAVVEDAEVGRRPVR